jgi:hypothetical protein
VGLPAGGPPGAADPVTSAAAEPAPTVNRGRHARPGAAPTLAAAGEAAPTQTAPAALDPVDAALAEAGIDVDTMLELLAANEPRPLEPLRHRFADKGTRTVMITGAVCVLTVVSLVAMWLLGALLH